MIIGGYTLDLCCMNEHCKDAFGRTTFDTFYAEEGATCRRRARKAGWKFVSVERTQPSGAPGAPGAFKAVGHKLKPARDVLCPACAKSLTKG